VREDLLARFGDRLLLAEARLNREGRETLLIVTEQGTRAERVEVESLLGQHTGPDAPPPALELIERTTFEAIERLAAAGLLQFTAEGHRLLHRSPALGRGQDGERDRRLVLARQTFEQAQRKVRMAAVLAGGGFAVEALPSLRDGVELALRSRAQLEGAELREQEAVPLAWVEERLSGHLALVAKLRGETEALLGAGQEEVRTWIRDGEALVEQIAGELGRQINVAGGDIREHPSYQERR
jgi:hypothetical protein